MSTNTRKVTSSYKFQNSIQTFAMLKESAFLSAFAGFLIFGLATANGFKTKSFFKFHFCDFVRLFQEITEIVQFLGKSDILQKSGELFASKESVYKWNGITITEERDSKMFQDKIVTIFMEENNVKCFEMTFTIPQINNLFFLLSRTLFSTLCLKDIEIALLFEASKSSPETIISLKQDCLFAKNFVACFMSKSKNASNDKKAYLIEILRYYNDLILIVHKLFRLSNK